MVQNFENKNSVSFWILKTSNSFKSYFNKLIKEMGFKITPEQFGVLYELNRQDGLYQKQLADIVDKDMSNMTRIIDILERKKLINRKIDEHDRRKSKLYITDKGKELVKEMHPFIEKNKHELKSIITDQEKSTLIEVLRRISDYTHEREDELSN